MEELERLRAENDRLREEKTESDAREARLEQQFRTLFHSMNEMVAIHDVILGEDGNPIDYRILDCNEAYRLITGIARSDAIGRLASELYGANPPPYLAEFSSVALTGESRTMLDYYAPMDKFFNISIVCTEPGHFATITTDLTDFHRAKNLIADKNKELESYLFAASHDLRSPLVNIQGFGARLERQIDELDSLASREFENQAERLTAMRALREEIKKSIRFISTNTGKMDKLIAGLLLISRTGRIEMRIQKVDMNALFAGISQSASLDAERTGSRLEVSRLHDCWGDESLLGQLFTNLVDNAIKYRDPARPLAIRVSSEKSDSRTIYRVSDNGIGIEKRYHDRIWEVFFRANPPPDRPGEGIGLSIVKRIAERHQGKVGLESEENVGTTFFVQIPSAPFTEIA